MSKPFHMVAIIDDDPRMLNTAANLLSSLGFRRQLYNSVEAFFADPRASQVGCLMVDLKLANAGKCHFARRLAESGRRSAIIFTMEKSGELDFRQIMQARCLALVRKPFSTREVVDALIRWLQLDRSEPLRLRRCERPRELPRRSGSCDHLARHG